MGTVLTYGRGTAAGSKARNLRISLGLTRRELADAAGVPPDGDGAPAEQPSLSK